MMLVKVLFFGVLKDLVGKAEERLDVPPGTTLGSLFASYSQRYETLQGKRPSILFARNQEFATADTAAIPGTAEAGKAPVPGAAPMTPDSCGNFATGAGGPPVVGASYAGSVMPKNASRAAGPTAAITSTRVLTSSQVSVSASTVENDATSESCAVQGSGR